LFLIVVFQSAPVSSSICQTVFLFQNSGTVGPLPLSSDSSNFPSTYLCPCKIERRLISLVPHDRPPLFSDHLKKVNPPFLSFGHLPAFFFTTASFPEMVPDVQHRTTCSPEILFSFAPSPVFLDGTRHPSGNRIVPPSPADPPSKPPASASSPLPPCPFAVVLVYRRKFPVAFLPSPFHLVRIKDVAFS